MNRYMVLAAAAVTFGAYFAVPATAQEVITNPGKCAQYYPNANCLNYGPGNPYRGPYSYQSRLGWRDGYAMAHPHYRRHHRQDWR